MARLLLLGGTEEARELAEALHEKGADFVTSLAGRTRDADYPGEVRIGGFGGQDGLAEAISDGGFGVVVDASHPFAAKISPAAKRAARSVRAKYYRLQRPPWRRASGDRWFDVRSLEEAAEKLDTGSCVFLAVGAGGIAPFLERRDLSLVLRTIGEPDLGDRTDITVIRQRGPFDIDDERELFDEYGFDTLVTKNSGGEAAAAKLLVARERRMPVYMVKRPKGQPMVNARSVSRMLRMLRRHL